MANQVKVLPPIAPTGAHRVRLTNRTEIVGSYNKPAYRWNFTVEGGEFEGNEVIRVTGCELRMGESLAEFLSQLGMDLTTDGAVDIDEPIGKSFDIVTSSGNGGGSRIAKITPVAE